MQATPIGEIRAERNRLLQESDRYVLSDYPHPSQAHRDSWIRYRQLLRDMMADAVVQAQGDPDALLIVCWPTPPPPGGSAPPS